jgi:large subunit ribosomal protein L3
MFYRAPGSIGASSFPSRVWKGQGLPGHMGSERTTTRNIEVVDVKPEQNLILVKGSVPGAVGAVIEIRKES